MATRDSVVFISGANCGIGFGLTAAMAGKNYRVIAGYRDAERSERLLGEANSFDNILPVQTDVTNETDLESLYDYISRRFGQLDILVNNVGVNIKKNARMAELEWEDLANSFVVNVGGPFLTTRYLYPLIKKGRDKKIVNITSQMASIQLSDGLATPYRVSKAALNMLTKNQAVEYKSDGVTVVCLHPGWVRTDMGGPDAPMTVEQSVSKIVQIVEMITLSNTGQFMSTFGDVIPY